MKQKRFTDLYVEYCSEQTDAPAIFHRFLSYLIVSSVVNKNITIQFGFKSLHPNLFLLIAAPSSSHRKSWSQNIAVNMIRHVNDGVFKDFIIPDTSSREAFITELASSDRYPLGSGLIKIDELKGFMDRMKSSKHYSGFIQDLSTIYDGDRIKRKVGVDEVKEYVIDAPFLNMTAACSLDWLYKSIESTDISGGFLARFIWVVCDEKIESPSSLPGKPSEEKFGILLNKLARISQFMGEASFDEIAYHHYNEWYKNFYSNHQGGMWDANFHRMSVIILKIATLNSIIRIENDFPDDIPPLNGVIPINIDDLKNSIMLVEDTSVNFKNINIGVNKFDTLTKKVLKYVVKNKDVTRSNILQSVRGMSPKLLDEVLRSLTEVGAIDILPVIRGPDNSTRISANGNCTEYLEG